MKQYDQPRFVVTTCIASIVGIFVAVSPGSAFCQPKSAISGKIEESLGESKVSGVGPFAGVILGDLPLTVPPRAIQIGSHSPDVLSRCIELSTSDGVYTASGVLTFGAAGLFPLQVKGFSQHQKILSSYKGENFAGILSPRENCFRTTKVKYIEPIYFSGSRQKVNVAINAGTQLPFSIEISTNQATVGGSCRKVSGRHVKFSHWCTIETGQMVGPFRILLSRVFIGNSAPPRVDVIELRIPSL